MSKKNLLLFTVFFIIITILISYLITEYSINKTSETDKKGFYRSVDSLFGFQKKITLGYFNFDKKNLYADTNGINNLIIKLSGQSPKSLLDFTDKKLYNKVDKEFLKKLKIKDVSNNFFRIKQINKTSEDTRTFSITYLKNFEYFSNPDSIKSNASEHQIFETFVGQLYNRQLLSSGYENATTNNENVISYINNLSVLRLSGNEETLLSSNNDFYKLTFAKDPIINKSMTEDGKHILQSGMSLRNHPSRRLDADLFVEKYEIKIQKNEEIIHNSWITYFFSSAKYLSISLFSIICIFLLIKVLLRLKS